MDKSSLRSLPTLAQSVIPAHSVPCCLRTCFHLLSLLSSMLFHHCLDSVSHSGSLGLWPSPLPSLLLPSPFLFEFRFLVSPKSEPSLSFRPTGFLAASLLVFPLTLLPLSPLSILLLCRSDAVGHSGPLGLSQPSLSSLFPPSSPSHLSLIPVGHSGPFGYWLPLLLFSRCRPPFFVSLMGVQK